MPSSRAADALGAIAARPIAHRGLFGGDIPENSIAAARAAIAAGHGVECDVRASRDGVAYVFHDERLDRLTRETGAFGERDSHAIDRIALANGEPIPRLSDFCAAVAGRVPLIVEVKARRRGIAALCGAVEAGLAGYRGALGVMSFDPLVPRWFWRNAPERVRGLVSGSRDGRVWHGPVARDLAMRVARAEFLAYDVRDLPSRFAARWRTKGIPVICWTVRDGEALERVRAHADQPVHEMPPEMFD